MSSDENDLTPRVAIKRPLVRRIASKLGEKALDNLIGLALVAVISAAGGVGAIAHEGWAHRGWVIAALGSFLLGSLVGIAAGIATDIRDRLRRANEARVESQQRFRYVEYQKELIYNALESIQQELAIEDSWRLQELVERGVLGAARNLLKRAPLEDVRLAVLIADEDGETWTMRWAAGHRVEGVRNYRRPIALTLAGRAYANREVVCFDDVTAEAEFTPNPRATREFRSLVAAPLLIGERVVGALSVVSTETAAFSDDEMSFIRIIAALIDVLLASEHDAAHRA